jgi:phosphomannomutase
VEPQNLIQVREKVLEEHAALLTLLIVLNILCREKKRLSELTGPLQLSFSTGELGFTVDDTDGIIKEVRRACSSGSASEIPGLRSDFDGWWFVLRAGSTEPKLRLFIEADTKDKLEKRRRDLVNMILRRQGDKA